MNLLMTSKPQSGRRVSGMVLAACALAVLAACAPLQSGTTEYPVGRGRLVLPQGEWVALDRSDEALPLLPEPGATVPLQTRAVGLRGAHKDWLAILLVQTNSTNHPRPTTLWTGSCPAQQGVMVEDATSRSAVRIDCLRFKRSAQGEGWLDKNHPLLAQWLARQGAAPAQPYSHLNYRYATEGGAYIEINALVDQRLLRPQTRSNEDFLRAGRPGQEWAHQLAEAARLSTSMMDGYLAVPPFPIAPPN
jgi:hypothetical protein